MYYFGDIPFYSKFNDPSVPNHPQTIFIDQQTGGMLINPKTPLPQYMIVDYFRYYQLDMTNCNSDAPPIITQANLTNFAFGIYKNITIGNGSSSISSNSGENIVFRASNVILINGDFTVPIGAELSLIPTPCYQFKKI